MNLGAAYTHILDFLAAQEPLPADVAKAKKKLEEKAGRLSQQQSARKRSTLCPCQAHHRSRGLVVCFECWNDAPNELRRNFHEARDTHSKRIATYALFEFAFKRRQQEVLA